MGLTPNIRNATAAYIARIPLEGHYTEADLEPLRKKIARLPKFGFVEEEWRKRPIDLKNVNRWIQGVGAVRKTQLMIYASLDMPDKVKILLDHGANPNLVADDGGTAIMMAVQSRSAKCIDMLLPESTSDAINAVTKAKKITALGVAIEHGDATLMDRLLDAGADPNPPFGEDLPRHGNQPSRRPISPLYDAVQRCTPFMPAPEQAFSDGAMIEALKYMPPIPGLDGRTFQEDQIHALRSGTLKMLEKPLYRHIYNAVAEHMFSGQGVEPSARREVVLSLLLRGADTNAVHSHLHGFTPFLFAAECGDIEVFRSLLGHGGNVRSVTEQQQTVLHLALWKGHIALAECILTDASPTDRRFLATQCESRYGSSPLHQLVGNLKAMDAVAISVVQMLLEAGASPDTRARDGSTPMIVAQNLYPDTRRELLSIFERGA